MAAAVQPSCLWNSQKTCYKTFSSTCRPRLYTMTELLYWCQVCQQKVDHTQMGHPVVGINIIKNCLYVTLDCFRLRRFWALLTVENHYSCLLFVILLSQDSPLLYQKGTILRYTYVYVCFYRFLQFYHDYVWPSYDTITPFIKVNDALAWRIKIMRGFNNRSV